MIRDVLKHQLKWYCTQQSVWIKKTNTCINFDIEFLNGKKDGTERTAEQCPTNIDLFSEIIVCMF